MFGLSCGLFAQEFPAYLRSNYIAKPLVTTKSNDFGLAPMTREYIVFCSNGRKGVSRLIREDKIDLFLYNLKSNEVTELIKQDYAILSRSSTTLAQSVFLVI